MKFCSSLFVLTISLQTVTSVSRRYIVDTAFDNKKSDGDYIVEYDAPSLSFCSALCGTTCSCFGFHLKKKRCQVHNSVEQTNISTTEVGWKHYFQEALPVDKVDASYPLDCRDIYVNGHAQSGVYQIHPFENDKSRGVNVLCHMENCGRWWTVIQKRRGGSVNFNRMWDDYKKGFGNLRDSFWIGNEVIHQLTKGSKASLYVSITLRNGTKLYRYFDEFSVSDETDNFRLFLGGISTGTLSVRMKGHSGMAFSTPDRDNDRDRVNCAADHKGGWWFKSCHRVYLNGPWSQETWVRPWNPTLRDGAEIAETIMMIRPH